MLKTNLFCSFLIGFAAVVFFGVGTAHAGTCPPLGWAADCNILITINPNGSSTTTYPDPAPPDFYDGSDDVYVGVLNNDPSVVVTSVSLSGIGIFYFDDDGAFSGGTNCLFALGAPYPCGTGGGTTGGAGDNGYASAGVNFSGIVLGNGSTTNDTGNAVFLNGGLSLGQLGLFSLEASPSGITTALTLAPPPYFVTYYSANQANAPDETVRIINDGVTGGTLWASIYVFDDSEELTQCCSCKITPDGVLSESVKLNLTANPIRGVINTRGVIKVIPSSTESDVNTSFAPNTLSVGLRAWATHVQGTKVTLSPGNPVVPTVAGPFFATETRLADSNLTAGEQSLIENLCHYDYLLSGKPCTCQPEDYDF